jgi:hypothetical protein
VPVRQAAEDRFGADFSGVRVHTDPAAAASARRLGADAYALGDRIAFDHGRFDPHTAAGRALLDHELAHVAQWRAGGSPRPGPSPRVSGPGDRAEAEADAGRARVSPVGEAVIHRKLKQGHFPVSMGVYDIRIEPSPTKPGKADVNIEFMPAATGPPTDQIAFMQVAKPPMDIDEWIKFRPEDKDLKNYTTADGAHMDVLPEDLTRRTRPSDPRVRPDYPLDQQSEAGPATKVGDLTFGSTSHYTEGSNNPGKQRKVAMTDHPGGGPKQGVFSFETMAYAKDRDFSYGTVLWEFRYNGPGSKPAITDEKAEVKEVVSPRFADAYLRFDKYYNP